MFVLAFHVLINELIPYAFNARGMFDHFFPEVSHFHHLLDGDRVCLEHLKLGTSKQSVLAFDISS